MDGRTQIGGLSIKLIDTGSPSTFTEKVRAQLASVASPADAGESLRNKEAQVWMGFTGDFDDFVQVITTYVNECSYKHGEYTLSCVDVTRQMRKTVFEQKTSRLAANLSAPDASPQSDISVTTVDGFAMLEHTAAFTDAPSSTVGYLKVKDTGEIIRYTGISESPLAFTGITREVFGTIGSAVTVDVAESEDQWPELEEVIYLEMPAPQLAYAVLTGEVLGSSPTITLPEHWHMGIETTKVEASEFSGIGDDLYYDDETGIILRFDALKKTDGKKFVESQIYRTVGLYSPVNTDGKYGLNRVNSVIEGGSYVMELNESNIVSYSNLKHKHSEVVNQYRIDYQYNGENYLRSLSLTDSDSISRNNTVKEKVLKLQGLHNSRHSQSVIYSLVQSLQARYRNPPLHLSVEVLPYLNILEVGDVVNVSIDNVQDFAGSASLDRVFEVQGTNVDWVKGRVRLDLFASTGDEGDPLLTPAAPVLADAFYTSKGTDIASISPSIVNGSGHITANATLTGDADATAAAAVYYYDGDLTIDSGVDLSVIDNVQLRVKGTLTINGTVDGVGNGKAGSTVGAGTAGYVGDTCATDGVYEWPGSGRRFSSIYGEQVEGQYSSFPSITVSAGDQTASPVPTDISGIPTDLRGTSGSEGGEIQNGSYSTIADGGDGGDSGAGLVIISRGLAFGASGQIDLSGTDGAAGAKAYEWSLWFQAGTGSGGGPGSALVLVDGSAAPYPDLSGGNFVASVGATVKNGKDKNSPEKSTWTSAEGWDGTGGGSSSDPLTGYNDDSRIINGVDRSTACQRIMYIPESA